LQGISPILAHHINVDAKSNPKINLLRLISLRQRTEKIFGRARNLGAATGNYGLHPVS
jgi:hypothetical protein